MPPRKGGLLLLHPIGVHMYKVELELMELVSLQVAAKDKAVHYARQLIIAADACNDNSMKSWHESLKSLYCALNKLEKS